MLNLVHDCKFSKEKKLGFVLCVCAYTLLITKGWDAHWPEPNVLTAVGKGLFSDLTQQKKQAKTKTQCDCLSKEHLCPQKSISQRPAEARGWPHGPSSVNLVSLVTSQTLLLVLTWNQHGYRQAAGICFCWSVGSCYRQTVVGNTDSTVQSY